MKLLSAFWRYWQWLCVALVTTAVLLYALSIAVGYLKKNAPDKDLIGQCIENGGTWDEGKGVCKSAA